MSPEDVVIPKQCKDRIIALETALDSLLEREVIIKTTMQAISDALATLETKVAGVQICARDFEGVPEELKSATDAIQRLDLQVCALDGRIACTSKEWTEKAGVLEAASAKSAERVNGLEQALTVFCEKFQQRLESMESARERDHEITANLVKKVEALEVARGELEQSISKKADAAAVTTAEALSGHLATISAALEAKADVGAVPRREEIQALAKQLQEKADLASVPSHKQLHAALEDALQYKADATGVASKDQVRALIKSMERKADVDSVPTAKQMQDLAEALKHKADCFAVPSHDQMRILVDTIKCKADAEAVVFKDDLVAVTNALTQKANITDVPSHGEVCSLAEKAAKAALKGVTLEKKDIDALIEVLGRKADTEKVVSREEVDGLVHLAVSNACANMSREKSEAEDLLAQISLKADSKDVQVMLKDLADLSSQIGQKADLKGVQEQIKELSQKLDTQETEIVKSLRSKSDADVVPTRAELRAIVEALKCKADKETVATALQVQALESQIQKKADIEAIPKTASLATRIELDHLAAQVLKKADAGSAFTMEDAQATIKAIKAYFCPKSEAQNLATKMDLEAGLNAVNEKIEIVEGLCKDAAQQPKQRDVKQTSDNNWQVAGWSSKAPQAAPMQYFSGKPAPLPSPITQSPSESCSESGGIEVQQLSCPELPRNRSLAPRVAEQEVRTQERPEVPRGRSSAARVAEEVVNSQKRHELPRDRSSSAGAVEQVAKSQERLEVPTEQSSAKIAPNVASRAMTKREDSCRDDGVPVSLSTYGAPGGAAAAVSAREVVGSRPTPCRPTGEGLLKRRRKDKKVPETTPGRASLRLA